MKEGIDVIYMNKQVLKDDPSIQQRGNTTDDVNVPFSYPNVECITSSGSVQ